VLTGAAGVDEGMPTVGFAWVGVPITPEEGPVSTGITPDAGDVWEGAITGGVTLEEVIDVLVDDEDALVDDEDALVDDEDALVGDDNALVDEGLFSCGGVHRGGAFVGRRVLGVCENCGAVHAGLS
jgi:hypothetical protein